ncbi:MAG TPA: cobyrinate a,c-diamide synthase [Pseudonocardiaceae bacterium]|nr:cobyrinate a,c-diamide synthase [Pseudonocardiaceae bacterium]
MPRLVIAAPTSGSGKTTVATGLIAALVAKGRRVAPFKVGPDYIDPGYHALAGGRPGRNLDPVLVGEAMIGPLFAHGVTGTEIAVIEGVMGLFDGRSTPTAVSRPAAATAAFDPIATSTAGAWSSAAGSAAASSAEAPSTAFGSIAFGSTAHVARLLDAPVVLVVDSRGQGRSLAALLHGFRSYDPTVRLAGVVLNQVGSARHEQVLWEACAEIGLLVLGAVPRGADVALPSRHLGLIPAAEHGEPARRAVAAMGELITRSVDLDAICQLAATAGPAPWVAWDAATEVARVREPREIGGASGLSPREIGGVSGLGTTAAAGAEVGGRGVVPASGDAAGLGAAGASDAEGFGGVGGQRLSGAAGGRPPVVAVAGGAAFTFGYAEYVELLAAAGASVAVVDPLRDELLPHGTAALVLPGGFPERHTTSLSANEKLRYLVSEFARSGGILQAECGGLLYLLTELSGEPMCGVLPGAATMNTRLTLGYRDAVVATDSIAHRVGERRTGHEFHHTHMSNTDSPAASAWYWRDHDGRPVREGFVLGNVHASYLHTHPAGQPETVVRLVDAAGGRS